jgi:hypothetical protein
VGDELATPVVVGPVAVERGAAGQPVGSGVGGDTMSGEVRVVGSEGGFALGIAGESDHPVAG